MKGKSPFVLLYRVTLIFHLFYREVNRITSVAEKFLQKRFHNKKDGDLVLTGHMKPFSNTNTTADLSSEILFCSVKECPEVASFKCNAVSKNEDGCRSMQFCTTHGPDHVHHSSEFYKDGIDYTTLRGQHNVKLFDEAHDRVKNKIQEKKKDEKNKKIILQSKIAAIHKTVEEKDELASVRTKSKMEVREDNIAKNAKFMKKVEEQCGKRSSNNDVKPSHSLSNGDDLDDYEIGLTVPINKKAKLAYGLSLHDQQLKNAVDRIISLANNCDNGRASKHVNFDVDIERELNTSYYWTNMHKLIDIYNLPTDQETQNLMLGKFAGNTNESNNRRLNYIRRICQLLRESNILIAEKVTSTRNNIAKPS